MSAFLASFNDNMFHLFKTLLPLTPFIYQLEPSTSKMEAPTSDSPNEDASSKPPSPSPSLESAGEPGLDNLHNKFLAFSVVYV